MKVKFIMNNGIKTGEKHNEIEVEKEKLRKR